MTKRWEFIGLLQFLRVYPDSQIDRNGRLRRVWMFEFRICSEITSVKVSKELSAMARAITSYKFDADKEERIEPAISHQAIVNARADAEAIEQARASIFSLDPRGFELLVKSALEATGFVDVSVTRYTQDDGIDVNARVATMQWPIAGLRVQVQAKRWLHTVGRREVAELRGSLEPFAEGAVVTTSFFSRAAVAEANARGRQPIVLIDGYEFASTARHLGLVSH